MHKLEFCFLPHRGVLTLSGQDRHSFLQPLVSNDLAKVSKDRCIHAALLTPQGKFLHEFFILEVDNEVLLLETELERLADLQKRFLYFRMHSKVNFFQCTDLQVAVVFGIDTEQLLTRGKGVHSFSNEPFMEKKENSVFFYTDPRLPQAGVRIIGKSSMIERILDSFGCTAAPLDSYEKRRVELGLPDGSRDIIVERSGLLECGFDELHGIDFSKGCYIGQEVTARSKYRGLVKRRLIPVIIEGPTPEPGTILTLDNQEVGEMRSAATGVGLASVRLEALIKVQQTCRPFRAGASTNLFPRLPEWMMLSSCYR